MFPKYPRGNFGKIFSTSEFGERGIRRKTKSFRRGFILAEQAQAFPSFLAFAVLPFDVVPCAEPKKPLNNLHALTAKAIAVNGIPSLVHAEIVRCEFRKAEFLASGYQTFSRVVQHV